MAFQGLLLRSLLTAEHDRKMISSTPWEKLQAAFPGRGPRTSPATAAAIYKTERLLEWINEPITMNNYERVLLFYTDIPRVANKAAL